MKASPFLCSSFEIENRTLFRHSLNLQFSCRKSTISMQDSLSDSEFLKLSEKVKPFTWIVRLVNEENEFAVSTYATAFSLQVMGIKENEILLMTCAHPLSKLNSESYIMVRKIDDEDFVLKADVVYMKLTWDIAILVVRNVKDHLCAEFARNGYISPCQLLLHVGHSMDMVWSVFVGRSAYQCLDNSFVPLSRHDTCIDYDSSSMNTTPGYRIMGHIWNRGYFSELKKFTSFEKNLHPSIPIIQCSGFSCREGCSGGPVFNIQGQIVGMIVGEFQNSQVAIHLTLLKESIKEFVDSKRGK